MNHTYEIKDLLENYVVKSTEHIVGFMLGESKLYTYGGVYRSTSHKKSYYSIFDFWASALYNFIEDTVLGKVLNNIKDDINCRAISSKSFSSSYSPIWKFGNPEESFFDNQMFPDTNLNWTYIIPDNVFSIIDNEIISSAVCEHEGEYLSYFVYRPFKLWLIEFG